jgi:hypothetical protein
MGRAYLGGGRGGLGGGRGGAGGGGGLVKAGGLGGGLGGAGRADLYAEVTFSALVADWMIADMSISRQVCWEATGLDPSATA